MERIKEAYAEPLLVKHEPLKDLTGQIRKSREKDDVKDQQDKTRDVPG